MAENDLYSMLKQNPTYLAGHAIFHLREAQLSLLDGLKRQYSAIHGLKPKELMFKESENPALPRPLRIMEEHDDSIDNTIVLQRTSGKLGEYSLMIQLVDETGMPQPRNILLLRYWHPQL